LNPASIKKVKTVLEESKNIVIVTHKNPDGDAIGSSMGLYHYLVLKGHKPTVIVPNAYPENLKWPVAAKKILCYEDSAKKSAAAINDASVIFCLDFNSLSRIDELGELIAASPAFKVIIDHHLHPDDFSDVTFSDTKASSTAQMIYQFIEAMGDAGLVNSNIANPIYMGIMTDTGSFRFPSVTSETHHIVAKLIDAGANNSLVHENISDTNTESRLRLLGYCLTEKMKVFEEFNAAIITLTKDELQRFNFKKGDTEGFVNYPLSIEGIKLSAFFTEADDIIRISFRSKGKFSVNDLAKEHFNGGGHFNAAGGASYDSMDETIMRFISLLPQYRNELNS
jgi:bifunctional oligoribonuclease and PAP phosphatase NrnA